MNTLIHFDVASFFVLAVIFFTTIYRKMSKGTSNRIFLLLIFTTIMAAVFEMTLIFMQSAQVKDSLILTIVKSLYMLSHNFATPVYLMYIISLTKTWHKLFSKPALCVILCIPYAIDITLIITNLFTGHMFKFENGVQVHKDTSLFYLCAVIYILISIFYVIYYNKLFKRHQLLALSSMLPLSIAAVVVKNFYPNSLVEIFSNTLGILLMSLVIQRPEEIIDSFTRLNKYNAYADDIRKHFINNNHVSVIMINTANFAPLNRILSYDGTKTLLTLIANNLTQINAKTGAHADIYYLDRGRFRVIVNSFNEKFAMETAEQINTMMKQKFSVNQIEVSLKSYVCLVRCPEDIGDFRSLAAFGDDFHIKIPYTRELIVAEELFKQKGFSLTNELDDIIENALTNKKLKVYYQPIYSTKEQKFTSAEALIRLIDDTHGFVPPDIFIPHAEKTGAIHKIGSFVLDEVCRFIASDEFKKTDLEYIEINLSVAQCMQGTLADEVIETLTKYNVKPSQINLEITETAASYNQKAMTENLAVLTSAGVSFSLDDFGTGYSNIDRVASLPLKIVKLDRSLVINEQKPRMKKFVENIIRMFKDMDMEIVVEGIETEQMVERFTDLECDYIQGYYFSKPIPESDFIDFLVSSK